MKTTTKQVLGTVLSLIATASFAFLAFAAPTPVAAAEAPVTHRPVAAAVQAPVAPVQVMGNMVIVGQRPVAPAARPSRKVWGCHAPRELVQGSGAVTECGEL
jgi:hypothetical protein